MQNRFFKNLWLDLTVKGLLILCLIVGLGMIIQFGIKNISASPDQVKINDPDINTIITLDQNCEIRLTAFNITYNKKDSSIQEGSCTFIRSVFIMGGDQTLLFPYTIKVGQVIDICGSRYKFNGYHSGSFDFERQ